MNKDIVYLFNNLAKLDEIPDQIRELNRLIRINADGPFGARSKLQDISMGQENISAFSSAGEKGYLKLCRITNPYFCWAAPRHPHRRRFKRPCQNLRRCLRRLSRSSQRL